jgi:hypothetical protein
MRNNEKADPHLQIKSYLAWYMQRADKRRDIFFKASIALTDGGYEIGDIRNMKDKK